MEVAVDKQFREITECPICMSTFCYPIMLPCIHTFCLDCMRHTGEAELKKPGDTMPCPLCRKEFIIPPQGMTDMPRNFFMENLLELKATLQSNVPNDTKEDTKYCKRHNEKPLHYYCAECKTVVCVSCFVECHKMHDCRDVATVEESFRQKISRAAWKASNYADEIMSLRNHSEMIKTDFLKKLKEIETTIIERNQDLKNAIDKHMHLLLDELGVLRSRNLKEMEFQLDEIDRSCTILKSFESYCTDITLKGSASDICSSVDNLITRAAELEKDHEAFIGRPRKSVEVYFQMTDLTDVYQNATGNLVGKVEVKIESKEQSQNFAIVVTSANEVVKVNLQRPNEVSSAKQISSKIASHSVAAVYCNMLYVTGVGDNLDEIWRYSMSSDWMKCASLVQRRYNHSAVFIDEVLYICGGYVDSRKHVLDSVEAYNAVSDKCTIVGRLVHRVVSNGNCVPFKSSLFIFGDANNLEFHGVQVYNTKENKCSVLSRPMPLPCVRMRIVIWDSTVIFLGMDTCFIFSIETETWQERKRFKTDVQCIRSVLENETVFVIAVNEVHCIPLWNILNDKPIKWKLHAKLPEVSSVDFNCVKMHFLV